MNENIFTEDLKGHRERGANIALLGGEWREIIER